MPTRHFFLTPQDFGDWFGRLEEKEDMLYCLHYGDGDKPIVYATYRDIPSLGKPIVGAKRGLPKQDRYFAHSAPHKFKPELYTLKRDGAVCHKIDKSSSKGCISFIPNGVGAGDYIIPGEISDAPGDNESKKLFGRFIRALHSVCILQDNVAVGQEAAELHFKGYRLCKTLLAVEEYDFRLKKPAAKKKAEPGAAPDPARR